MDTTTKWCVWLIVPSVLGTQLLDPVFHCLQTKIRFIVDKILWQSSRPAGFSPAGLTLWPSWLQRWLMTLSGLSVQVRIPVGLSGPGHYIGGSSAGLGKAQRIDSSLRADWLSCFCLAWSEWRVARQGCLVPLRKGGMWQSSRPASFPPAGLSWLERWLATLSGLSVQVWIPVGLSGSGHYNTMSFFCTIGLLLWKCNNIWKHHVFWWSQMFPLMLWCLPISYF